MKTTPPKPIESQLRSQLSAAAGTRNAAISVKFAATKHLAEARTKRETDFSAGNHEAVELAESALANAEKKLAAAIEKFQVVEQELNDLNPQPNLAKRLVAAIDRALAPETTPGAKPFENVRRQLSPHQSEGNVGWTHSYARFGVPDPMLIAIREAAKSAVPDYAARTKRIQELHKRTVSVYAELNRIASKPDSQTHEAHIAELSKQIVAGKTDVAALDGYSKAELEMDRRAKMDAFKNILRDLSVQIYHEAKPVISAALTATGTLLEQELKHEGERALKWGIPYLEPSEILRSLHQARNLLEERLNTVPTFYGSIRSITANLIPLE